MEQEQLEVLEETLQKITENQQLQIDKLSELVDFFAEEKAKEEAEASAEAELSAEAEAEAQEEAKAYEEFFQDVRAHQETELEYYSSVQGGLGQIGNVQVIDIAFLGLLLGAVIASIFSRYLRN